MVSQNELGIVPDNSIDRAASVVQPVLERQGLPHSYILFVHNKDKNWWEFPGGKVEKKEGETDWQAARREVKEESGVEIPTDALLASLPIGAPMYREAADVLASRIIFSRPLLATFKASELPLFNFCKSVETEQEHDEAVWVRVDGLFDADTYRYHWNRWMDVSKQGNLSGFFDSATSILAPSWDYPEMGRKLDLSLSTITRGIVLMYAMSALHNDFPRPEKVLFQTSPKNH